MMKDPCSALAEFFEAKNWDYLREHDGYVLRTSYSGVHGHWRFVGLVADDHEEMLFYSLVPAYAPAGRQPACLELINLINRGLCNGSFDLVPETGLIRFRTVLPLFGGVVSQEAIECQVGGNLRTTDRYFGAIMRGVYAGMDADEALKTPAPPPSVKAGHRRFEWN